MVLQLSQAGAGPNTSTITTANSTNPRQWDTVTFTGSGTTATFDSAQTIHGNPTACKFHLANVASTDFLEWKAAITTSTNNSFVRWYFYKSATPANASRVFSFMRGSSIMSSGLNLNTSNQLILINSSGIGAGTMTATVPNSTWCRIEFESTGFSGTTSTLTARLYSGANVEGSTPDTNGTITASGVTTSAVVNATRFGAASSTTANSDWWYQDMAFNDTVAPGAYSAGTTASIPKLTVVRNAVNRSYFY